MMHTYSSCPVFHWCPVGVPVGACREQRPQESPASWFRAPSLSQEPLRSNLQKLLWGFHQQGKVLGMQVRLPPPCFSPLVPGP